MAQDRRPVYALQAEIERLESMLEGERRAHRLELERVQVELGLSKQRVAELEKQRGDALAALDFDDHDY